MSEELDKLDMCLPPVLRTIQFTPLIRLTQAALGAKPTPEPSGVSCRGLPFGWRSPDQKP